VVNTPSQRSFRWKNQFGKTPSLHKDVKEPEIGRKWKGKKPFATLKWLFFNFRSKLKPSTDLRYGVFQTDFFYLKRGGFATLRLLVANVRTPHKRLLKKTPETIAMLLRAF
jgi:hypothetical protein